MEYESDKAWMREMLRPGEELLWTGKPGRVRLLVKTDLIAIAVLLIVAAFGGWILRTSLGEKGERNLIVSVVLIVLLAISAWRTLQPILQRYLELKSSRYALTSQRVIAQTGNKQKSLELTGLPRMTVAQRDDGSGDILFGADRQISAVPEAPGFKSGLRFTGKAQAGVAAILAFREIPEVTRVERRIQQAVDQALAAQRTQ